MSYEKQGTAHDPHAAGYELQGRDKAAAPLDEKGHDPKLAAALRKLVDRLEATPEELRGPFLVKGLKPYLAASPSPSEMDHTPEVGKMVLVPREPTDEMLQAFEDEYVCMFGAAPPSPWCKAEKLFAAMLAAAPNASKDADDVNAEYEVNFLDSQGGGNG